jgi:uncharacterized protein (TIGR00255 family)
MKSMTGYGRASGALGGGLLAVQIESVNRKVLDLTVSLPGDWEELEQEAAAPVRQSVVRGKVHVRVEFESPGAAGGVSWDEAAVSATLEKLAGLAASQGIAFRPTPELLWQVASSQRQSAGLPTAALARAPILAALDEALHAFNVMRAKEGEALLVDFLARVALVRRHVEGVAARAPLVAPAYRESLLKRLRESGLDLDAGDERVLKEIALFADRCDVSEEITRMRSHLDQFAALLRSEGEIGRKAEFILQELGREAHTIGSKANDLTVSRHVIELKNELERIREQIANVE